MPLGNDPQPTHSQSYVLSMICLHWWHSLEYLKGYPPIRSSHRLIDPPPTPAIPYAHNRNPHALSFPLEIILSYNTCLDPPEDEELSLSLEIDQLLRV